MKILIQKLESLNSILDSLSHLGELEPTESDYLLHLLSELEDHSDRLLAKLPHTGVDNHDSCINSSLTNLPCHETSSDSLQETPKLSKVLHAKARTDRAEYLQRALEELACSRFEEARLILESAVDEYPNDDELLNHLGLAYWELGEMRLAAAAYEEGMALSCPENFAQVEWLHQPDHPFLRATEGCALAYNYLGERTKAIPLFEMLFHLCPNRYSGCIYLAGESYHLNGNIDDALRAYRRSPHEPCVIYNKALAYLQVGDQHTAATTLVEAFALNPHIAANLLTQTTTLKGSASGFLKTSDYAIDFLSVCRPLWDTPETLSFLQQLFEHPLVQSYLTETYCDQDLSPALFESDPSSIEKIVDRVLIRTK